VAALAPRVARAEQGLPVVGFLGRGAAEARTGRFAVFHQALAEVGYVAGSNVAIEYRWAEGRVDRFPELVADLVHRRVTVIAALAGIPGALAAKAATTTIPIVFQGGFDPVELGLIPSLSRPGGNITGVTSLGLELGPKRLEIMHELMPAAKIFALLINPDHPNAGPQSRDMQTAARSLGVQLRVVPVRAAGEFDAVFAAVARLGANAVMIGIGQPLTPRFAELGKLAARHAMPTIAHAPDFAAAGGLISYGSSQLDAHRIVGVYVGRILKGEKPADLPVQQATKVEMIINLKAAKALGLTVPISLLGRADEVIE
jgi:putative ABC transport system substrate-binding protein